MVMGGRARSGECREPRQRTSQAARGGKDMWKRLIIGAAVVGTAVMGVQSLPDVVRYLKIRSM